MEEIARIKEAVSFIQKQYSHVPQVGVVLGSGLGNFTSELKVEKEILYSQIPYFPVATVEGHSGKLFLGEMSGKKIVAMAGRFHYYEGYKASEVAFPVRVMKFLGIKTLLISNASGGVHPEFRVGDLMIIRDHISFATSNPLIGKNDDAFGPRFPDMSEPYRLSIIEVAKQIAEKKGIQVREGVYFGVTGPSFETRAEYKMIRIVGADAVGMSTVQEVVAANHMGLPVFALSVITDLGIREEHNIISHQEVLDAARAAEPKLTTIFKELIGAL